MDAVLKALALLDHLPVNLKALALQQGANILARVMHDGYMTDQQVGEWHGIVMRVDRENRHEPE